MATPHDRRTISPDNQSLYSQLLLGLRPWLGSQYAVWNARRLSRYATQPVQLTVPVISLGNITFGGTGKTPLILSLVRWLHEAGHRPGVIAAGHGGSRRRTGVLVSDGIRVLQPLAAVGEEAQLLAHALKSAGVPVAAGMKREQLGQMLLDRGLADCLVLDDGFQYRTLQRDADLVLIDATNPFGAGGAEAYGFLREPPSSLRRASAILLTKGNLIPLLELPRQGVHVHRDWVLDEIRRHIPESLPIVDVPVQAPHLERVWHPHEAGLQSPDPIADPLQKSPSPAASLYPLARPDLPALEDPALPQHLMPVTALGNPEAFEATCRLAGLQISQPVRYEDHYVYSLTDLIWWNQLLSRGTQQGIVVSSKDWVKIHPMRKALQMPCWVLTADLSPPDWGALLPATLQRP
ncbi:MAG: Tetraacyldisaccharide 4'-kinase [bacterium]|nr:Tetraacyldisaccharide 4'-kinase [bacterium]